MNKPEQTFLFKLIEEYFHHRKQSDRTRGEKNVGDEGPNILSQPAADTKIENYHAY